MEVLGISVDHIYAQNVFETTLGTLPYPLLSDWRRKAVKSFGVFEEEDGIAKRSCFLINKEGKLVYKNEAFKADDSEHYKELLTACDQLK
ncbi:AhpC/TSA family protein [Alkalicoccus daliensis]|uniref:AhpC/TSA family protein n=1 Tax=Alkalicoccus daliensis TaxID=745820 RepID=A0A1H0GXW2_9BACI|nr:AhpC/TSA family protein [Alkalicoccus daliensis]